MAAESNPVKGLFLAALQADPADRAALLDRECAGDPALRARVEGLLRAHAGSDSLLDRPLVEPNDRLLLAEVSTGGPASTDDPARAGAPTDADALAFLAPGREPGSLGRLDHYEILEVVGRGGMGLVLKARDTKLQRVVAVKVLAPQLAASGTARRRFVREAQAAAAVRDEHVVAIHAVEDAGPVPYLVMEFIAGITLDDRIRRAGPPELADVLRIGMQAAAGLAAAHAQGLIHRDVKPANILLENGVQRVKLTDFGLARAADDASITQSGLIAGTPLYMSPEQARGDRVDHRSDLFSLGSVLYTLAAGRPAFQAETMTAVLRRVCDDTPRPVRAANPDAPAWLDAVIGKLLAKDPADRFQSAAEVADLLGRYLAHVRHPEQSPAPRPPRTRSRAAWAAALAAAVAAAGGAAGFVAWRPSAADTPANAPAADAPTVRPSDPAKRPSPLDRHTRADLPAGLLALVGNGDPAAAPPDLVAVLTDPPFALPRPGPTSWPATTRDGRLVAVPCGSEVALFDATTGALRRVLAGHTGRVYCAAFSPDGKRVAAGNWNGDNTVRVWDAATGKPALTLTGHTKGVDRLAYSPDGTRLATAGSDGELRVWDARTGEFLFRAAGEAGFLYDVAYSPDGARIASTGADGRLWVWDAPSGAVVTTLRTHPAGRSAWDGVAFSPDGARLAGGSQTELRVWDTATWAERWSAPAAGVWLAFTPDGKTLLAAARATAADRPNTVTRWGADTGKPLGELPLHSRGKLAVYHLSPDGTTLYSMRCDPPDPVLHAYDATTGADVVPPYRSGNRVWGVAFSPDGRSLASANEDGTLRLWDLAGWRPGEPLPPARAVGGHTSRIWGLAYGPDGTLLASGSYDGTVVLWDVAAGRKLRTVPGHPLYGSMVAFSPDGRTLAVGRTDGSVRLWDAATGMEGEPVAGHAGLVIGVAYSADGRLLASAGYRDRAVNLHDAATGRLARTFRFADREIDALAVSPDGRAVAAGGSGGMVQVWDAETGRDAVLRGHAGLVEGLAFHPVGRLLATASEDGTVRVWDAATAACVRVIGPGPFGKMARRLAFSPDGRYLATANFGGTVTVLRTPE